MTAETDGSETPAHERETAPPAPGSAYWWAERAAATGRRRPRTGGLSVERIVAAAVEVVQERGLEALTVRAVADRLGTGGASLYRHIASLDELIVLIVDHTMGDVRLDRTGRGWRTDIEALMREMRRVMLDQPLPSSVTRGKPALGPNMLRVIDSALALFLDAGLTDKQATSATTAMIDFVVGATSIQRSNAGRSSIGAAGTAGFSQLLDSLPADEFAALRAAGTTFMAASGDDVFTDGMAIFLDGVTSRFLRER
ncbi:TetR/AcrR family transcriptional regulator [Pseudofrankia sp. BMG5.37]|uniref:TetR/AcrR family transcriptional regulator n=1 Tax=Pseudofrankia sp. BMG5.37 TaxID=3050035 RepID=UPI002894174D|nr:TetR/AcrR family transcriptional regulator [Pseudofrankia sp. BMG5.37]MDT3445421.1 TetR/AcrR family transcriptional regulator [Pseudofrankia sp. BMG5.37]